MNRRQLPLNALRTFEAFGRHLHSGKAAEELGVTPSAVSHQLKKLEQLLNKTLIHREGKSLHLTATGRYLFREVSLGLDQLDLATKRIDPELVEGQITVATTSAICANWLLDLIGDFSRLYPQINFELQQIPRLTKKIPRDVDLAICYGRPDSSRYVKTLIEADFFPVAAPFLFLEGHFPETLNDLFSYPIITDVEGMWSKLLQVQGKSERSLKEAISCFDVSHAIQAARKGIGIAMADRFEVAHDLEDGTLVRLLDYSVPASHSYYLVSDKLPIKRVALFTQWLMDQVH